MIKCQSVSRVVGDESTYFDGKEVIPYIDYLKGTGAIAILSIMPVYVSLTSHRLIKAFGSTEASTCAGLGRLDIRR